MNFPTIVAFSVGNEKYHKYAARLKDQCIKFDYPYDIDIDVDLSVHKERIASGLHPLHVIYRYIPSFILSKMKEHGSVLYLHCDFQIKRSIPEEAFDGLDIGLQRRWKYAVERSTFPMLAAPIFARNNFHAYRFLKMYEAFSLYVDSDRSEHVFLRFLWKYLRNHDRSLRLDYFNPHIATLQRDADAPIVGHKSD